MIQIKGARLESISWARNEEATVISGNYSLISDQDKVLAKQGFNGYSDIKVAFSADTLKSWGEFQKNLKSDINLVLGMEG